MASKFFKPALAAGIAAAALVAPAHAQVNGVATSDITLAVAQSQALQTAWQQVGTTYSAQIDQLETLGQQRAQLVQQLDTNTDGQLDEAEQAALNENNPTVQQINALDEQIGQVQAPIQMARLYVLSQVGQQYAPAVQEVISNRNIQLMVSRDAVIYAADEADVTMAIVEVINTRLPSVASTPPADWRPTEATIGLYEQVQQVFATARAQQQQQGAAQQQAPVEGR